MAIDLESIRKKVAQLNGTLKKSKVNYWKPEPGEYTVRVLPWPNNDGQPFKERWFYYGIGKNPGILAPTQFQKPDPVQELIDKLHSSGKKEDKDVAKKLYPKMRVFAPIIVRGSEEQGVMVWSFGKEIYQRLLEFFLDSEINDFTDTEEGYDLKVKITKLPNKMWPDTTVDVARKPSRLSSDKKKIDDLLSNIPNFDEMHRLKTYEELKGIIEAWTRGDEDVSVGDVGSSRALSEGKDELDKLTDELATKREAKKSSSEKMKASKKVDDEEINISSKLSDLDSVFDEILDS